MVWCAKAYVRAYWPCVSQRPTNGCTCSKFSRQLCSTAGRLPNSSTPGPVFAAAWKRATSAASRSTSSTPARSPAISASSILSGARRRILTAYSTVSPAPSKRSASAHSVTGATPR